jgi:hypothetical protein
VFTLQSTPSHFQSSTLRSSPQFCLGSSLSPFPTPRCFSIGFINRCIPRKHHPLLWPATVLACLSTTALRQGSGNSTPNAHRRGSSHYYCCLSGKLPNSFILSRFYLPRTCLYIDVLSLLSCQIPYAHSIPHSQISIPLPSTAICIQFLCWARSYTMIYHACSSSPSTAASFLFA